MVQILKNGSLSGEWLACWTFLGKEEEEKVAFGKVRIVGILPESFNVLLPQVVLHRHGFAGRGIIMQNSDPSYVPTWFVSVENCIQLSEHRVVCSTCQ